MTPQPDLPAWMRRPVVELPPSLTGSDGRRLRPGSAVEIVRGPARGRRGEVAMVHGRRSIEVLLDGDVPEVVQVAASDLRRHDREVADPATLGWYVTEQRRDRVGVLFPVGSRDVQVPAHGDLGPFPSPSDFATQRVTDSRVDARVWGAALCDVVDGLAEEEAAQLVAAHLDAPMLRRVLEEATLPSTVERLVMVVTDQTPPHRDDTSAYGRLLSLWLQGTASRRERRVVDVPSPLVLHSNPHLMEPVRFAVADALDDVVEGLDMLVVVQAGGTPAMATGMLLAAALHPAALPTRHIQVPFGGPLIESDFPALQLRKS